MSSSLSDSSFLASALASSLGASAAGAAAAKAPGLAMRSLMTSRAGKEYSVARPMAKTFLYPLTNKWGTAAAVGWLAAREKAATFLIPVRMNSKKNKIKKVEFLERNFFEMHRTKTNDKKIKNKKKTKNKKKKLSNLFVSHIQNGRRVDGTLVIHKGDL
eukprot:Lithocolla_globosa_v1_NODE_3109_length_1764_cov_11314.844353.p1 type:complete len:159 gc:universal NODE_3109_length_1764_cov_11314.844353:728-252(-)